jgi:molecular chaperone HscC
MIGSCSSGRLHVEEPLVGIDLGTTNSAVAYIDEAGPRLIPNALGDVLTPSVVGVDPEGKVLVGRTARELMVTHPDRCAAQFKRRMGSDWTTRLAGRSYTPEELSALVLRALKQDAEAHLGRPVSRAVITVPAYFNDDQRKATINAGRIAGLKVERILNEPTAAALAYGFRDPGAERVLLVFDLGGGTFDVSVVDVMEGVIEVRASAGEGFLGGEDFTRVMAARLLERGGVAFEQAEAKTPHLVSRLIPQCETAKRTLSREASAAVRIPDRTGAIADNARVEAVTRADFVQWCETLLNRMEIPVRRALADAGLKRPDIDEVLLVGGATRMPIVIERVTRLFAKEPLCGINPDEVVALGAGVLAGLIAKEAKLDDLVVTDIAPFSLGIAIAKTFGLEHRDGYFLPIIQRNTTIPVSRVETVGTIRPNQTQVTVQIYQGEARRVEENLLLGEFEVNGIPRGPAGQTIDVRFTYDLNGVLEVEAVVTATRKSFTHVVTRYARGLSAREIERAVANMQSLKTHPRDEAMNRFLLQRAERVFGEAGADVRQALSQLLDGFEEALGLGDPDAITRNREALEAFLNELDGPNEEAGDAPW